MIFIKVTDTVLGTDLAHLRLTELDENDDGYTEYLFQTVGDRGNAVGLHTRSFFFKKKEGNILGLLQVALSTLDDEDLVLEHEDSTSNLVRGFGRLGIKVPRETTNPEHNL